MRRAIWVATGIAVVAGLASGTALAQPKGDPQAGERKAFECLGCHASEGRGNVYPSYNVPKVGGQQVSYIMSALKAYASGKRKHPTMQAQAKALSPKDMRDIAAFFAQQGPR